MGQQAEMHEEWDVNDETLSPRAHEGTCDRCGDCLPVRWLADPYNCELGDGSISGYYCRLCYRTSGMCI